MARTVLPQILLAAVLAARAAGAAEPAMVLQVDLVGPYAEVRLSGPGGVAVLVPPTEACARVVRPEAAVRWTGRGFPGRLEAGDARCEAVGILDLEQWRDRRPRPQRSPPRATARWETIHRDGRRALLRGRFPLAPLVGMSGAWDLVAVVADDDDCAGVIASDDGTLEYRASGSPAFLLFSGRARCPVLGFARPLPSAP